jgi:pyocin large subunit-like protein
LDLFERLENAKQYVEHANSFLKNSPSGTLERIRSSREILKYNPSSNTFGAFTKDNIPKTLFKPDSLKHSYNSNLNYFYGQ